MFIVPPGGPAGFAQMTPASKAALGGGPRRAGGVRRRKKRKSASGKRRRSTKVRKTAARSKRTPKFGGPAWRKKYKLGKAKKG